jgi:hypothetical protein
MDIAADKLFRLLQTYVCEGDAEKIGWVISQLGWAGSQQAQIPDATVERLLALLKNEEKYGSKFAGQILNFFEFESCHLTDHQKRLCVEFLREHGDHFNHVHSRQVVTELRHDHYLK